MSEQLRTAAQAALEALEEIMGDYDLGCGRVQARALRAALAEPQPEPVTRDQIRDMVKECGIDWHRGFVPLFDGDDTNRYEVLVREVIDRYAAPQAQQHDCERRPYGDLRNAKWLDPECYAKGACQSLIFKQAQQPQPEPYCYIYEYDSVLGLHREFYPRQWNGYLPSRVVTLYAAPTAQQPLTDEQIDAIPCTDGDGSDWAWESCDDAMEAMSCPWCDRQDIDICQHADDAKNCEKTK